MNDDVYVKNDNFEHSKGLLLKFYYAFRRFVPVSSESINSMPDKNYDNLRVIGTRGKFDSNKDLELLVKIHHSQDDIPIEFEINAINGSDKYPLIKAVRNTSIMGDNSYEFYQHSTLNGLTSKLVSYLNNEGLSGKKAD